MTADHAHTTRKVRDLRRADLARATGCNLETIRYYEGVGVLPPPRAPKAATGPMTRPMCSACAS